MGPPKVGYTPPTLATCVDDLGHPSKAVSITVLSKGGKVGSTRISDVAPHLPPLNRGYIHPLSIYVCFQCSSSFLVVSVSVSLVWELELSRAKLGVSGVIFWRV